MSRKKSPGAVVHFLDLRLGQDRRVDVDVEPIGHEQLVVPRHIREHFEGVGAAQTDDRGPGPRGTGQIDDVAARDELGIPSAFRGW